MRLTRLGSMIRRLLVTGSSGLIGSEVCRFFSQYGYELHGIDNNQRGVLFGTQGDTRGNQARLLREIPHFTHHEVDIRDRETLLHLVENLRPQAIVHAAAQPSHDRAASVPFEDFDTNAVGTLNLLEAARRSCPEAPFVHMSTNKVYGDRPNSIALRELETRWDYADPRFAEGIPEDYPIDHSMHSLFGASKVAADILVQEYGRYFDMPTCSLRCGCLTGPWHAGVELHGFLSYLVRCNLEEKEYRIFGYGGKQVRDNIHARDVAQFIHAFIQQPRMGAVYNMGGGKANSCSVLEAMRLTERISGIAMCSTYLAEHRRGDHICYYSDLTRIQNDYPGWAITYSLEQIIGELVDNWRVRLHEPEQAG